MKNTMKNTMKNILMFLAIFMSVNSFSQNYIYDQGFGYQSGFVQFDNAVQNSISLQSDGKIIIGGPFNTCNGVSKNGIVRLTQSGIIDPSFNIGTGFNGPVESTAIQSDGKIIVGGSFTSYNGVNRNSIARLNTDGSLDATFNQGTGFDGGVYSVVIQPDGKIIAGGSFSTFNSVNRRGIIRLNSNGTLDTSFDPGSGIDNGGNGTNIFPGYVYDVKLQTDGKIIVGGSFARVNLIDRLRIARLNSNGTLDVTFNVGTGFNDQVNTLAIQTDGKIIAGGWMSSYNGATVSKICRLNSNGTLDNSFTPWTGYNMGFGPGYVHTLSIQSDGKIIVGGTQNIEIKRLNTNGSGDLTFIPQWTTYTYQTLIQPDGKILVSNNGGFGRLTPCSTAITHQITSTVSQCNPYVSPSNNVYGNPGTFNETLYYTTGCDSVYLNMELLPEPILYDTIIDTISSCGWYTSPTGAIYGTGIHSEIIYSVGGCDSVYLTLELYPQPILYHTITDSTCPGYISPSNTVYNYSGTYYETIYDQFGCDSVYLTLDLTMLNSETVFYATICNGDSYTWNNQQYTQSGIYNQLFTNQFECDSLVTLILTVENANISISANPTFGNAPLNVAFANQTNNLSSYSFTWYFGDGTSQQSNSPFLSHTYTQDAYSDVTVVAENITTGCLTSNVFNDMIFVIGGVTCTHTATLNQTGPLSTCTGDSVLLSCNTDPTFSYQWNRNGVPVSGATSSSIYAQLSGSYTVTIYQNNCPVTSNGISVTINPLPAIPTITSSGTITSCSGGSLTLSAPTGLTSYSWNTGATSASIVVTQSGNYTVTVTNASGCARTSAPYVVNASFMSPPTICVVGMDSLTNENRIVWEKPLTSGIDSFYVYKETNVSDVYTKIGATDYPDLAVLLDQNSNPAVQAYRYKLTVLDTCGTETPLSDFHKTIHLTINAGVGGAWNLIWSHYEGLTFGSYNIYRGTDPTNISLLTSIQSNLNSYTDLAPPVGPVYYQVEIVNPNSCDPTKVINYSVSRSNIVNNGVNGINVLWNSTIIVYPNPTSKDVTLEITSELLGKDYFLTDNTGRIILTGQFRALKETVNLEQLATGVYFIKIDNKANLMYKVVKN